MRNHVNTKFPALENCRKENMRNVTVGSSIFPSGSKMRKAIISSLAGEPLGNLVGVGEGSAGGIKLPRFPDLRYTSFGMFHLVTFYRKSNNILLNSFEHELHPQNTTMDHICAKKN